MSTQAQTGLTYADLDHFPDDGRRYELVDGQLFVSPLARRRHQWVVTRLAHRLMAWTDVHGGTVYAGVNVDLADDTHLEPDVGFARSQDTSGLGFERPPDLVVEVSSPSTRSFDLGEKKDRYAADGAEEFWFVDLDADVVQRFVRRAGRYDAPREHRRGEALTSELLPGLVLDVDDLLGPPEDA
jgi:Uma2 family endonuclease